MARESIRLGNGATLSGRLVDHMGNGWVEIEHHGRRYAGRKVSTIAREARQ